AWSRKDLDASTLNGLAWICATNNVHVVEALQAAERAAALEPKSAEILDALAEVHYRSGNAAKAIEVESRALSYARNDQYLKEQINQFKNGSKYSSGDNPCPNEARLGPRPCSISSSSTVSRSRPM